MIDYANKLISLASFYEGISEVGGNNKGPIVEWFQKAVDGKASGEPWCMAMAQCLIAEVVRVHGAKTRVFKDELCWNVWDKSPRDLRIQTPVPGSLVIWRHADTMSGHVGICKSFPNGEWFDTIEGNTSPQSGVVRDGDGVYFRTRSLHGNGNMSILGFLRVFD